MFFPPSPHDPFRPTNWRWERARWLKGNNKYSRRELDDRYTTEIKRYLVAHDKCKDDSARYILSLKYPGLYYAERLHSNDRRHVRYAVEARLLSGQSLDDIAEVTSTSPDVIGWYEKTFFNVLPHLGEQDYIINIAMGESIHHGLKERDYDLFWKLLGYLYGKHVLNSLIMTAVNPQKATSPDMVRAILRDDYRFTIERRAVVAGRIVNIQYNTADFMSNYHKLLEIEKMTENRGEASDMITFNIQAMAQAMPLSIEPNYQGVDAGKLEHYDKASAELRASEMISICLGQETEEHKEVAKLTFKNEVKDDQENQQGSGG